MPSYASTEHSHQNNPVSTPEVAQRTNNAGSEKGKRTSASKDGSTMFNGCCVKGHLVHPSAVASLAKELLELRDEVFECLAHVLSSPEIVLSHLGIF